MFLESILTCIISLSEQPSVTNRLLTMIVFDYFHSVSVSIIFPLLNIYHALINTIISLSVTTILLDYRPHLKQTITYSHSF